MKSTDYNLNNPLEVETLNLYPSINYTKLSNIIKLTMEEYELIKFKDPTCIYVITDSIEKKVYYGEFLVEKDKGKGIYLLGPANEFGEYTLYLNETYGDYTRLIRICRYNNPQIAINDLNKFNNIGSHNKLNLQIYNIIVGYITKDISIHNMLIGIISAFGYRDDTKLQSLIQTTTAYCANSDMKDLPDGLKKALLSFKNIKNHLFRIYTDLYDLIAFYNYFQGKEFQKDREELDLSKVIEKIFNIMTHIV